MLFGAEQVGIVLGESSTGSGHRSLQIVPSGTPCRTRPVEPGDRDTNGLAGVDPNVVGTVHRSEIAVDISDSNRLASSPQVRPRKPDWPSDRGQPTGGIDSPGSREVSRIAVQIKLPMRMSLTGTPVGQFLRNKILEGLAKCCPLGVHSTSPLPTISSNGRGPIFFQNLVVACFGFFSYLGA